ncbi:hypothetical protein YC2023_094811 [Brassica napus]
MVTDDISISRLMLSEIGLTCVKDVCGGDGVESVSSGGSGEGDVGTTAFVRTVAKPRGYILLTEILKTEKNRTETEPISGLNTPTFELQNIYYLFIGLVKEENFPKHKYIFESWKDIANFSK